MSSRRGTDGWDAPFGIDAALGAVAVVVVCALPTGADAGGRDARFALLALGVAAFAATVGDLAAVAVTAGVAFLLFDGFVEGRYGDLAWHGSGDAVRLGVLAGAGLLGSAGHAVRLAVLRRRRRLALHAGVAAIPRPRSAPAESILEEGHRG